MIPRAFITAWRAVAPWQNNEQVEQDLVLSRSLVELFLDDFIRENLAFRGGTALHKLYLAPSARYSEDLDMIQIRSAPIGPVFDRIKTRLKYLGEPKRIQKERNNTLLFRFDSEIPPVISLRLKVEVNCREHDSIFGLEGKEFEVNNPWFRGKANITTFCLEELLGSKMRALYQRKRGRDLFDLWYALVHAGVDNEKVLTAFRSFMQETHAIVNQSLFYKNMKQKIKDSQFIGDTTAMLRPDLFYDPIEAYDLVMEALISRI